MFQMRKIQFPPKKIFTKSEKVLEQRRKQLEVWPICEKLRISYSNKKWFNAKYKEEARTAKLSSKGVLGEVN